MEAVEKEVTIQELAQAKQQALLAEVVKIKAGGDYDRATKLLPEHKAKSEADEKLTAANSKYAELEDKYRAQMIYKFKATGEKAYHGGGVSVGTKVTYDDEKVIAWLKEHNFANLISETYSKSDVKKMHTDKNPVDGITTEQTITTKVNADLSEFLFDPESLDTAEPLAAA